MRDWAFRPRRRKVCLAIPAKVIEIQDEMATVDVGGITRQASLLLLDHVDPGDYVIVHAGFAIHKLDHAEAEESLKVLREMVDALPPEEMEEY